MVLYVYGNSVSRYSFESFSWFSFFEKSGVDSFNSLEFLKSISSSNPVASRMRVGHFYQFPAKFDPARGSPLWSTPSTSKCLPSLFPRLSSCFPVSRISDVHYQTDKTFNHHFGTFPPLGSRTYDVGHHVAR